MTTSVVATKRGGAPPAQVAGVLLLLMIVSALFYYKWGGSLRTLGRVHDSGKLAIAPSILLEGNALSTTLVYFGRIWPALLYGIFIGAAVRAAVPAAWVKRWFGDGAARSTLIGAVAGAPLMLCSCCVTPVFSGLYERGARLGPSLTVMLASPGFNLAALALSFALLPARVAALRVAAAVVIVFGLSAIIGRVMEDTARTKAKADACAVASAAVDERVTLRSFLVRFGKSLAYMIAITVPLIVVGVVLSSLLLPYVTKLSSHGNVVAVAVVALIGTLVALPTFFEIPVALLLLAMGAPAGVAVAFVVAGPIVNLPSLFVLARETRPRVAVALGVGVWLVATAAGLGA